MQYFCQNLKWTKNIGVSSSKFRLNFVINVRKHVLFHWGFPILFCLPSEFPILLCLRTNISQILVKCVFRFLTRHKWKGYNIFCIFIWELVPNWWKLSQNFYFGHKSSIFATIKKWLQISKKEYIKNTLIWSV